MNSVLVIKLQFIAVKNMILANSLISRLLGNLFGNLANSQFLILSLRKVKLARQFFLTKISFFRPKFGECGYRRMYDSRWLRHLLLSFSSPFGRAKTKPKMPHLFLPKPPVGRELLQELNFRRRQFVSKKQNLCQKNPFLKTNIS